MDPLILAAATNCTNLMYGVGMHGTGPITEHSGQTLASCCALRSLTHSAAFTFHNSTGICDLSLAPLNYHVSSGTVDATSGCAGACPTTPGPDASPIPGPLPPGWPNVTFPPALPTMPTNPVFPKAPRPNM